MTRLSNFRCLAIALLVWLAPATVLAQGTVRTQGRDVTPEDRELVPDTGGRAFGLRDYREDMRRFVQAISTFARGRKRNFLIVPQNGLSLLIKDETLDETRKAPARTYMRSIDAVLQEGLFHGIPAIDEATEDERREKLLPLADRAKAAHLNVLVMDFATTPKTVREAYRLIAAKGFIPFVAPARGADLNRLPAGATTPWAANPKSVISLTGVKNFGYLRDSAGYGRQDEFALAMHGTNYDALIVDVFHGRRPLTKQAVETLRYKKLGSKRLVLAYVDIGSAESHRFYWQPMWREGSPFWIKEPYDDEPDKYHVEFWRPGWQSIISGNTDSYIYGVIAQGFDGVVLGGMEAFRYFEGAAPVAEATP